MIGSYARNGIWYDQISLYEDTAKKSPHKTRVLYNLAKSYAKSQRLGDALIHFEKTILLDPTDPNYELAHEHLAYLYYQLGKIEKTIHHLESAIKIQASDKNHYNLGLALQQTGNVKGAIVHYKKAIEINSAHPDAYLNLANAYFQLGLKTAALAAYQNAHKANPDDNRIYNNLKLLEKNGAIDKTFFELTAPVILVEK